LSVPSRDRTLTHAGTSRVSTPAPELLVIDFFAQHPIQPQHQLASYGDQGHGRVLAALEPKVKAPQLFVLAVLVP